MSELTSEQKRQAVIVAARELVSTLAMDRGPRHSSRVVRNLAMAVCELEDYPNPNEGDQREWWRVIAGNCVTSWRGLMRSWSGKTSKIVKGEE